MRKGIIIRLQASASGSASWAVSHGDGEGPSMVKSGTLAEAAAAAAGARLVVLVPAADVLLAGAAVPATQRRRIQTAVPYALEDQLAQDVENLHFAVGRRDAAGMVSTAVVAHATMQRWHADLAAVGLQPAAVFPDVLALPWQNGEWTLLIEPDAALLRTGEQAGMAIDLINLEATLQLLVASVGEFKPQRLRVLDARGSDAPLPTFDFGIDVDVEVLGELPVAAMGAALDEAVALDLLQGDYSRREQLSKVWRPWRPAAGLLGALLVVQLAAAGVESVRLGNESAQLYAQAVEIYRQAFPDAKNVPDPRGQMEQKLRELRGPSGGGGEYGLLELLGQAGEQLKQTPGFEFERLNYRAGEVNISFRIGDLQQLDALKQLLGSTGLTVEIQSATSRDGKVDARLNIARPSR